MHRAPAWVVLVGVLVGGSAERAQAAGVWVTLAAGLPGASAPTSSSEFWFDTPGTAPAVAVNSLTGGTTAQASSGGGDVFFGGSGTPVLLNLADGSAYVAGGSPPDAAKPAGTASAAPAAGGTVPADAALLGINLAEKDAAGARGLTATVTDAANNPLGTGSIVIPDSGWWVLGLTPGASTTPTDPPPPPTTDPGPTGPPPGDPPPVDQPLPPPPPPPPITPGGPAATPEPSTLALVGIGGLAVHAWRRNRAATAA